MKQEGQSEKHSAEKNFRQRNFWLNHLNHEWLETDIPADYIVSNSADEPIQRMRFVLSEPLVKGIEKISKGSELNVYAILISGVFALLRKYLSADELQIGTPVFGTNEDKSFANHLIPIRGEIHANDSFKDILIAVKATVRQLLNNQNYPIALLKNELKTKPSTVDKESGTFNIIFVLENLQNINLAFAAKPKIIFGFNQGPAGLEFNIYYTNALYSANKILSINENFQYLLTHCLRDVEKGMRLLDIQCHEVDAQKISANSHDEIGSVIEQFHKQVRSVPYQTALIFKDERVSYRELDRRAEALANTLDEFVIREEMVVGILLDRSVEMIISILAILKCGACYLPLDPTHPMERLNYILADSGCKLVITNDNNAQKLNADIAVVSVQIPYDSHKNRGARRVALPGDVLYVIYTSGTTGKPKGVVIENRHLLSLFFSDPALFQFSSHDTWVLFHTYCFDFSVWEIFGALLFGGQLVIMDEVDVKDPAVLLNVLKNKKVTVLNQTPSAFYNLIAEAQKSWPDLTSLRYVIFGGEVLTPGKLKKWYLQYPSIKLINMYGITETTVHVTYKQVTSVEINSNCSNIGVPLSHLFTYLINSDGNRVPPGYTGEIVVNGASVSRGYLNKPELTTTKFLQDIMGRSYRSGDLAYLTEDNEMIYIGRKDMQVQLRGYRIEVSEIEFALMKYEGIENAIVLLKEGQEADKYLCAYYVSPAKLSQQKIRKYLTKVLPVYMVPSYIIFIEKLPLNHNGKIDLSRLPEVETIDDEVVSAELTSDEQKMVDIWRNNLGIPEISLDESYFSMGGDSIKAIRLLNRINSDYDSKLKLRDIYKYDTVRKLIGIAERKNISEEEAGEAERMSIEKRFNLLKAEVLQSAHDVSAIEDIYPMADIQVGMAYYSQIETTSPLYHDQMIHVMTYPDFDYSFFLSAVDRMCKKHSILRAAFNISDYSEPLIFIYKTCFLDVERIDLTGKNKQEQNCSIQNYLREDRLKCFTIEKAPLWRIRIFQLNKDTIAFLWVCHHSIIDGWSDAAFKTELNNTYLGLKQGKEVSVVPLKASYKDFVINEILHKKNVSQQAFWKNELSSYNRLPFFKTKKESCEIKLGSHRAILPVKIFSEVRNFCRRHDVSHKTLFFTAYNLVLQTLTYDDKFVVGFTTHNRPVHEDGEKVLGCFLNVLPYVVRLSPGISWIDLVKQTEEKLRRMNEYDQISLMEIVKIVGLGARSLNPFFDTLFNYIDFHVYNAMESLHSDTRLEIFDGYTNTNTLLDFNVSNTQELFEIIINYDSNSVRKEFVVALGICYQHVIERFISETPYKIKMAKNVPQKPELKNELRSLIDHAEILNMPSVVQSKLDAELIKDIQLFLAKNNTSMSLYFTVISQVLLYKYTLKMNMVVGLEIRKERPREIQYLVSSLLKTLPVQANLITTESFIYNYQIIQREYFRNYENSDLKHDELLDWMLAHKTSPDMACAEAIFTMCYDALPERIAESVSSDNKNGEHYGHESALILIDAVEENDYVFLQISSRYPLRDGALKDMINHFKEIVLHTVRNENIVIDDITLSADNNRTFSKAAFMKSFDFSF